MKVRAPPLRSQARRDEPCAGGGGAEGIGPALAGFQGGDSGCSMDTNPAPEILELSVAERIQLVEDIWDSIAADPERLPLPAEQAAGLDRRLDDAASPAWRSRLRP